MIIMENPAFQGYIFQEYHEECGSSVMVMKNDTGEGEMRCFDTFAGITLGYNSLRMTNCYQQVMPVKGFISLNYCRKGCFEVVLDNGDVYFMREGDFVISDPGRAIIVNSRLPVGFYEGVSIMIERTQAQKWIEENAAWSSLSAEFFDTLENSVDMVKVFANRSELWHQAEGFYTEIAKSSKAFRITKVLELLSLISVAVNGAEPVEYYSATVTEATEAAYKYLSQNLMQKITVEALCEKFNISKTNFQKCFKSIYGQAPASYIRSERMKYAAKLILSEPDKSIGEIASILGYDNASKFSAAFRAVMNECPLEYRHHHICCSCQNCGNIEME